MKYFSALLVLCLSMIPLGVAAQTGGAAVSTDRTKCDDDKAEVDCRNSFAASFYVGAAVDNFAGDPTVNYLNGNVQSQSTWREIAGVDFAYRLYGNRQNLTKNLTGNPLQYSQLWVYGETLHGVRSKEVQCKDAEGHDTPFSTLSACNPNAAGMTLPGVKEAVAIIKGASSLEAFVGARWEIMPLRSLLQATEADRARLYVKAQIGTLNVVGGGNAATQTVFAIGAMAVSGKLVGSYLEVGTGKNNLFLNHKSGRLKMDAFLSVPGASLGKSAGVRPFAQITVDNGRGHSDSIQSYVGFDINFGG